MAKLKSKSWMSRRAPLSVLMEWVCLIPLCLMAVLARFVKKPMDVGIGPEPLINNPYHKKALIRQGYSAETFVMGTYFITDEFDVNLAQKRCDILPAVWRPLLLFARALFRYKVLMIYFHGGPLFYTNTLGWIEPYLLKLAKIKVIVMPYGADVQDMTRSKNLAFRHATAMDYPQQFRQFPKIRRNIHRWTTHADWAISGVEWVDYMPSWNTLMLGHFSIDADQWRQPQEHPLVYPVAFTENLPLRIFHAPNHRHVKGSQHLIQAIQSLQAEGCHIELVMLEKVSNEEIRQTMATCHVVADQFVLGWYAMFALEAMAMGKPVLCYLREDLLQFYQQAGLLEAGEMPLINTGILTLPQQLRWVYEHPELLRDVGQAGVQYVRRHHSLEAVGAVFSNILQALDILPQPQEARLMQEGSPELKSPLPQGV